MSAPRMKSNVVMTERCSPREIQKSVFAALGEGEISYALDQFDDRFTFKDRALGLEFSDKEQLREYFKRSRELFPGTAVEVKSTFQSGDFGFAEWKLTATQSTSNGAVPLRSPISLPGASMAAYSGEESRIGPTTTTRRPLCA